MLRLASPAGNRARSVSIGGAFRKSPNRTLPGGEHDPAKREVYESVRGSTMMHSIRKGEMPCVHANCWLGCSRS